MTSKKPNNFQAHMAVGVRIRVYWPGDNEWYSGVITEWNRNNGVSRIRYDDSEEENLLLDHETWEFESPLNKLQPISLPNADRNVEPASEPILFPLEPAKLSNQNRNSDPPSLPANANPPSEDPSPVTGVHVKRRRRPSVRLGEIGGENLFTFGSQDPTVKKRSKTERVSFTLPSTVTNPTRPKASSGNVSDSKGDLVESSTDRGNQESSSDGEMNTRALTVNGQKTSPLSKIMSETRPISSKGKEKDASMSVDFNKNKVVARNLHSALKSNSTELPIKQIESKNDVHLNSNEQRKGEQAPLPAANAITQTLSSLVEAIPPLPKPVVQVEKLNKPNETSSKDRENMNVQKQKSIREWLDDLGLSKYYPLFQLHEIDENLLPHITMDDLKEIGIWTVGARRKMITSISKLSSFRDDQSSKSHS